MFHGKEFVEENRKEHWSPHHQHRRSSSWCASPAFLPDLLLDYQQGEETVDDHEEQAEETVAEPAVVFPASGTSSRPKPGPSRLNRFRNNSNMKLDLQAVKESQNSDSVVRGGDADVHLQKERLAASQKECSCILPYLFLAGSSVAQNLELLQDSRITHIINFVGFVCPELFPENFIYRTLWLQDSGSEDILCILYDVFDLIEIVRELRGCRVLLHCCQGVSRSASLTIAYLMWRKNQSFEDAFHEVKSRRQVVNPNMGFVSQLMHWQRRISLPSERDALQIYRVAPHSPYDPLYLVPKVEGPGGIELLDTRGAFVIRYMNMLYIWKGQECHKEMLSVADNAAFQLVRYERAQGPCVLVREGKEKADISNVWSELLTLSRSMSRSVGGRVARYDADYEMYTNTKMGVYTPPRLESGILINLQPKEENWIPVQDSCSSNSQR